MKAKLFLIGSLVFLSSGIIGCQKASSNASSGGDTVGNGGSTIEMDFKAAGLRALEQIELNEETFKAVDSALLKAIVDRAEVETTKTELVLKGQRKDAINYPSLNKIVVNESRWMALSEHRKTAFALHEYLGLMNVDDSDYQVSLEILRLDPETFEPLHGRLDVVIVVDDSASMLPHQISLAGKVDKLWKRIRKNGLDFRIAVVTSSNTTGKVSQVITPATPKGLEKLRRQIVAGTFGSGNEMFFKPVLSTLKANPKFLRPKATLELIFLTDTDDQSPDSTPSSFFSELVAMKKDASKIFAYGIVALPSDSSCVSESETNSIVRLMEFINKVNGDYNSICAISPSLLDDMGSEISARALADK